MRVSIFTPKPIEPVVRLTQFRDGGCVLINHCSPAPATRTLDYNALIAQHGNAEVDHAFKVAMTRASGGGMAVPVPGPRLL